MWKPLWKTPKTMITLRFLRYIWNEYSVAGWELIWKTNLKQNVKLHIIWKQLNQNQKVLEKNYCGCHSRFYLNRTVSFDSIARKWADIMRGIVDLRSAAKTIDLIENYFLLQERWRHHSIKQNGDTVKKVWSSPSPWEPWIFYVKGLFSYALKGGRCSILPRWQHQTGLYAMRYCRHLPRCEWDLRSFWMLHSLDW